MGELVEYEEDYLKNTNCNNFVETGCYLGNGLRKASQYFDHLFSCDISLKYVEKCKRLFPDAVIVNYDSLAFLDWLCPLLNGPTVFWLDAHYPHQYDASIAETDENRFPLLDEMAIIKEWKRGYENDFIICDDLRVIQSEDNPVRGEVGDRNLKERHFVHNHTFTTLVDLFKETHNYKLVGLDGLIFIPKGATCD